MSTHTLVILRHAKADQGGIDRDRPLTPRGRADAQLAGAWLASHGYHPDVVLCSPARRTKETWHGVALALTAAPQVLYPESLYGGSAATLGEAIAGCDDGTATLLLIGHNPAVSELCADLDPEHADPDGLRTSGIAVFALLGTWAEAFSGGASRAGGARPVARHTARANDQPSS